MDKFDKFILNTAKLVALTSFFFVVGSLLVDYTFSWAKIAILAYVVSTIVIFYYQEFKK